MVNRYQVGMQLINGDNSMIFYITKFYGNNMMTLSWIGLDGTPRISESKIDNDFLRPYSSSIEDGGIIYA